MRCCARPVDVSVSVKHTYYRFLIRPTVVCLLLICCGVISSVARAQDQISLKVPDLLTVVKPDPFDAAGFQPQEAEEETLYPLPADAAGVPPKRKRKKQTEPPPPPDVRFTIFHQGKASGIIGSDIHAERNVVVKINELNSGNVAMLYADVFDYRSSTGIITASGSTSPPSQLRLVMDAGALSGDHLTFNVIENRGVMENATMAADTFRIHGKTIEAKADGSFVAHNAMFTTCIHGSLDGSKGYPDYRVQAKDITVIPGKYVRAKHVVFYLGRQKTIPLESMSRSLETSAPVSSVPTPSYNRVNGLTLHLVGEPESARHATFDYNVQVSTNTLPTGYMLYQNDITHTTPNSLPPRGILNSLGDPLNSLLQQFNPPTYVAYVSGRPYEIYPDRVTFYGILGNQQYIFNRSVTNLSLSRLPEAGIHIGNILGKPTPDIPTASGFERDRIPYAPALLEAYFSTGVLHENPTGVTAGRAFSRLNFASQPQLLGPRLSWRFAATNWLNAYTSGTVYELFAPEAELDYVPTKLASINLGYRYLTDSGQTPFTTDRRDIRHEARLQFQAGGPIRFAVALRYDIAELRPYDEEIAIIRNLDCLQYGINYRILSRQFNVVFSLLPVRKKQAQ